ncbi:discoidin domain-containing protein [Phytohabitans kaempferiae]|uniref:Discoidin domain-containing protein n=1 Tax=Phytohabitans kaempferiae TaxID=1620943 RepID=A0ABV6M6W2_9ACTN
MPSHRRVTAAFVTATLAVGALAVIERAPEPAAAAAVLPSGFQEQTVYSGLTLPMNIEFAPDGRVFVAEKGGRIVVYDNLADTTPTTFANLAANVHNQNDRGLLGLALHPRFPTEPWVYVLYTYDAPPGQSAPVWNDNCGAVGGANGGRCVVTARLSRLQAAGNVMTGGEQVFIHDWCQQYPSHSVGDLRFGADGMLYVSAGDGASYNFVDYGQLGSPPNPCSDPPNEGGALRAQDVRGTADPTGLDGTILRLDPATGLAAPGNPLGASADVNARRIVAHGLRNPYRFAMRPGTNELWLGDVGWGTWEELNRLVDPVTGVTNFGWPCFEGAGRQDGYDGANLPLCESLYTAGGTTAPYYAYGHFAPVVAGEACPIGGSSISGVQFYPSAGPYPAAYRGGVFFADYSRNCIWAMLPSATSAGLPDPANRLTFVSGAATPVDLAIGPGGELYYVDIAGGTVRRIRYFAGNQPPVATIAATPTSGAAPLTVQFDGSASSDVDPADQGRLRYEWDFTDDGTVDATTARASHTYPAGGPYTARLRVYDTLGASGTRTVAIQSGNGAPVAVIDSPAASLTWKVGDTITFSGRATDPQQGTLPASALRWRLLQHHCVAPTNCHVHAYQDWVGVAGASFPAPDHEYPSYLELVLTATDASGLASTTSVRLNPRTVNLTFASSPPGLRVAVGSTAQVTPFTRTVIQGSATSVSAVTPQVLGGTTYTFANWSDRGGQTHVITAPTTATTYTASFASAIRVPRANLRVRSFDSQETVGEDGRATNAIDGNRATFWHTRWQGASPPHPHEIQLDLGRTYAVTTLFYLPRQNLDYGRIAAYEVHVSTDGTNWGTPVATGRFVNSTAEQAAAFASRPARYVRLRALGEVNNRAWTTVAELAVGVIARLPQSSIRVRAVDSEETAGEDGRAVNVLDGNPATFWHTRWQGASPPHPHQIELDLGAIRSVSCVHVLPRQNLRNGRIARYEVYTATDPNVWTTPAASGTWPDGTAEREACFTTRSARYIRVRALSEVNGSPWTAAAEITVAGV